jgi:putative ABC transport system permease protein
LAARCGFVSQHYACTYDAICGALPAASQGLLIVAVGLGLGILAALGISRLVGSLLVGIGEADPLTYAAVSIVLAVVALAACYIPAHRAMRVDPMVALRYQ